MSCAGVVAGCGGTSPRAQVRAAWSSMRDALASGDGARFCALLTDEGRAAIIQSNGSAATCAAIAGPRLDAARDARRQLAHTRLLSVTVHRNTATTTDSTGPPADTWRRVNGRWELATLDDGTG